MNIAITNVSNISKRDGKIELKNYVDQEGNRFKGIMTNEAPLKSLLKRLSDRGDKLDRILYIESDLAREPIEISDNEEYCPAEYLRHSISNSDGSSLLQFDCVKDCIHIDDNPDQSAVSETVFAVYRRLVELYDEAQLNDENKELNVFIESNGGVRYVLTMLLSITKVLENSLENFHIIEITSMVVYSKKPVSIANTKAIYDTTQIASTIEEYVNYGRINSMGKYVSHLFKSYGDEETKNAVEKIMQDLTTLAEDIQLCRTKMMLDDFYLNGGVGREIVNFLEKYEESREAPVRIFSYILRNIKTEYDTMIYEGYDENADSTLNLPKVIRWCLNKNFVQQALTLCSERIPEYLMKSGTVQLSEALQKVLADTDTKDYESSYYFFAHLRQDFLSKLECAKINNILTEIQSKDVSNDILSELEWESIKLKEVLPSTPAAHNGVSHEADKIYNLALRYMRLPENAINDVDIRNLAAECGFCAEELIQMIPVSGNMKLDVCGVLVGMITNAAGERCVHVNLVTRKQRIMRLLPGMIKNGLPKDLGAEEYNQLIDNTFKYEGLAFKEALKAKYSSIQSWKYYVRDAMDSGCRHILTNLSGGADSLQRILYLFSLCKEQRNLSNHAHVSEEDREIAMNTRQLRILIEALLDACSADAE